MRGFVRTVMGGALLALVPAMAWAQAGISGVVTDVSGGVLPGVTVEASSPVLIEKVRSVVTDGSGQYRIVDLRPGVYAVSFTLPGFAVVRRENVELTGTFTATVNAEMKVGGVEETVTVTGDGPIVDTHGVGQQRVLDKAVLDGAPIGRSHADLAVVVPGLNTGKVDVGGKDNLQTTGNGFTIHGSRGGDLRVFVGGQNIRHLASTGQSSNYMPDLGSAQEITIDYAAGSAEMATGGVLINVVPKEGGNVFSGSFYGTRVSPAFQGSNLSQDLRDQGLRQANRLKLQYDINPALGGPLLKDKLWFFQSARFQTNQNYLAGVFANVNAGDPSSYLYSPDFSRQGVHLIDHKNTDTRLTWQVSQRNKLGLYFNRQWRLWEYLQETSSPEARDVYTFPRHWLTGLAWSAPWTNKLLLDVRYSLRAEMFRDDPPSEAAGLTPVIEQSTGLLYRGGCLQGPRFSASNPPCGALSSPAINDVQASLSYVTGAHAIKVGFTELVGKVDFSALSVGSSNVSYRFNNGVPNLITEYATPFNLINTLSDMAVYVQDSWTVSRLTINGGLRYEHFTSTFPEYVLGPSSLLPQRNLTFPKAELSSYHDLNPRVGVAYDLFGDAKTAVKASLGRYGVAVNGGFGNPVLNQALQVTRSWTPSLPPDHPDYFTPQCSLADPLANGDCGTISDLTFGSTKPSTVIDPKTLRGWHNRPYNWEFSTSVQRELLPRVSSTVGYFRRWFGNFTVTDNTALVPADFSPYSLQVPVDPRLPDGGGYTVAGLYDLNPDKVGQVANYQTFSSAYGSQIEHWNGVDFTVDARPPGGLRLQGGVSTGRTTTDSCDIARTYLNKVSVTTTLSNTRQVVQSTEMCRLQEPFLTQVKLLGTYPVPRIGLNVSAVFQSLPGPHIAANYVATSTEIQSSLGRPLSGGVSNVPINIVQPGTMYGERANALNLRFGKSLSFGKTRAVVDLDVYNVTNANPVLSINNNYGAWLRPLSILDARLFRLGARFEF